MQRIITSILNTLSLRLVSTKVLNKNLPVKEEKKAKRNPVEFKHTGCMSKKELHENFEETSQFQINFETKSQNVKFTHYYRRIERNITE
ncbi:hypothetical protein I8748_27690 [Nostoc sp. CENA67]|uniref:Uncharacterized protein n=1 Tax=Amazonocrinis nigriterrae CENA67 TaxID=2794033 RepID=A0A8J7HX37_9NOST|nr:hypothetical protein [Amazonocrinis nigriterrae]MBH8565905.1 hypothetical protein [Amazonocrinis nigriterrae CENA67]